MDFKLAMTLKELRHRTSKTYFKGIKFLSETDREVKKLSAEDKLEMRLSMKDLQSILFSNRENLRYIKREPQVSQECYIS